jgi:hypothetical protein
MHDRKGNPITVGDKVWIPCIVKGTMATDEYCNVTLESEEPMYPGKYKSTFTVNAKQTEKQ